MNVSFDEESYSVNERDGFIEQCVVLDGQIQREVVVYLSTLDGSAKGMIVLIQHASHYLWCLLQSQKIMNLQVSQSLLFLIPPAVVVSVLMYQLYSMTLWKIWKNFTLSLILPIPMCVLHSPILL